MTPARTFLRAAVRDTSFGAVGFAFSAAMAGVSLFAFYLEPQEKARGNELQELWLSMWEPLLWFPSFVFALFAAAFLAYFIAGARRIFLAYKPGTTPRG